MASNTSGHAGNTIKVVARFRPPNKTEVASGGQAIVDFESEDTCKINSAEAAGSFTFDRVFDTQSRQSDVFDFSIRSTVDDILNGYNGTVFAYGQTGAGKSYTMMGASIDDEEQRGIIPRIVEQMFASILESPSTIEYTVRVSYMEIYMEKIRDLLVPQNDNLPVHEEKSRGVYVKGLLEIYVSSVLEVFEVMRRGGAARATAATNMNQESSRSHSIFVITITQKNVETGSAKSGQLFLVDLAGSEKVGKTGASGQTLEEAKKINKSLSALGMVINSLTDGKSTHIPYRDSKLTRILQESLGGNSRTTLIINCSPSSYNDQETLSTLRFGVRAKAIKNKAKVNAELSPGELKVLLKKAQGQVTTFETYVSSLEGELLAWRAGEPVSKERWITFLSAAGQTRRPGMASASSRPATPSRLQDPIRAETPGRADSRLERDEREEFLRRENELQDQMAEKESALSAADGQLQAARNELQALKESSTRAGKANEKLVIELNEMRMQLERVAFESKEAGITMDSLKEANTELTTELDEVKQQMMDLRMSKGENNQEADDKQRKKAERMTQMMSSFELGNDVLSESEQRIKQCLDQIERFYEHSVAGELPTPEELENFKSSLFASQNIIRETETRLNDDTANLTGNHGKDSIGEERISSHLEDRLNRVESDYEKLLSRQLTEQDTEDVKSKLSDLYIDRHESQLALIREMREDIDHRKSETQQLRANLDQYRNQEKQQGHSRESDVSVAGEHDTESSQISAAASAAAAAAASRTVQQQIADFDVMKKSLMRDLQNRCERVVELEISLDETREQYKNVLRSSNNRAQQKKMAFLERNLEQLTQVQRQMMEQNGSLKKEVAIAERKLAARTERIGSLEALLHDSQEKLTAANHRFEAQLTAVKERLEAAKAGSTRGMQYPGSGPAGGSTIPGSAFSFGGLGPRIAKPLRGGGGGGSGGDIGPSPISSSTSNTRFISPSTSGVLSDTAYAGAGANMAALNGVQNQESGSKRSSWFFSDRR